jgi:ABC-2 type transport system permease protein
MRLCGLLRKEVLQILRDPSSIALAIVMPVMLLFLFGYGVSLDPQQVAVAVVLEDGSPAARDLAGRLELSRYFRPIELRTMQEAETLIRDGRVDAAIRLRGDFADDLARGSPAPVQLIINGVDSNRARLIEGYARGAVEKWGVVRRARGQAAAPPPIEVVDRIWFNEAADSANFLVPGLLTLIMTLSGALLTALVVAREWERGTMEAMLATPLRPNELLIGKVLPYFLLGMCGMALTVIVSVTLFSVPLRGSLWLLVVLSGLFMMASLGMGLAISAVARVQFVAAQAAILAGFLPAVFLSGLIFDLQSTPWAIQLMSYFVPARYFVEISHTIFMAGNVWSILLPAGAILALMAIVLLILARTRLGLRLTR